MFGGKMYRRKYNTTKKQSLAVFLYLRYSYGNKISSPYLYPSKPIRIPLFLRILHIFFDTCIPFLPLLGQAQLPLILLIG